MQSKPLSNDLNSFTEALLFTHRGLSGLAPTTVKLLGCWPKL